MHECCVPGCPSHHRVGAWESEWNSRIEFAHVRHETTGGVATKPHDWYGIALCAYHHRLQHQIGEPAFERMHGLNMKKLAMEFARNSPDIEMRETMKELGIL